MISMLKPLNTLMIIGLVAIGGPARAQETDAALGEALMAADGTAGVDAGIASSTGWFTCSIVRTGAGWGNNYVMLTCPGGAIVNIWHIMPDNQKDEMLATALAAATSNNDVQVYVQDQATGYDLIRALYIQK